MSFAVVLIGLQRLLQMPDQLLVSQPAKRLGRHGIASNPQMRFSRSDGIELCQAFVLSPAGVPGMVCPQKAGQLQPAAQITWHLSCHAAEQQLLQFRILLVNRQFELFFVKGKHRSAACRQL